MPRMSQTILGIGLVVLGVGLGSYGNTFSTVNTAHADDTKKEEPLDVRYARLFLRQSQIDLERALETNRRMPGSFQSTVIDSLRRTVSVAENWLEEATAKTNNGEYNPSLKAAEALAKSVRDDYAKIQEINRLAPKSINPMDLERAKVAVELADLRIARAKAIDLKSPTALTQMQIEILREEIVALYSHVAKLEARN